ncbi:hypothetical protein [Cellulophaga baltica]|uniref:Uncharacterized protein n=1 Tax=Cellulophaga baltica 18 TaxID=1348584 RepID=A0AAU8RBP3_9FLAO|nr:hypothetical protein [Cellulophaga baltica]AIZ40453.1 hypothetical protein M666_01995 [Cellulophaga baltica 18]
MEIIKNNPYRIAGILSNASERELQKQKTKIRAFSKVGKEIKSDFDFDVLGNITRTEDLIDKAFSNVEQNQDKVNFSLFWFLNASPFDNTAFEYLKNGNDEKADEIWKKVTQNKEVNSKNFSAFSNLGTYKLLSESQNDIKEGIDAKVKLIESDFFKNFVHTVADETFTIDSEKQIKILIDELLMQFKNQYSSTETLQLFSNCNGLIQKYLSKRFTEEPIHNIESLIESTKNKRKKNKSDAYQYGLNLANKCKAELILLQSLIGTTDLKYKTVADQLANEIMQCGIDYFNKSKEDNASNNYLQSAQKLTKIADSIAVGKLTKERAQDSLATLEEMKDRELSQAIDVLESIKSAYENNAVQLMAQVKKQEASMGYGQSINWSKVTEMIMNSIDWDKATELIIDVIPKENIVKIKNSQNTSKINDYKKLVDFILGKLGYTHKIKVKYLQYWESTRIATTATRTASTPQSTENEGIPDWLKWVGGIILFILLLKACN